MVSPRGFRFLAGGLLLAALLGGIARPALPSSGERTPEKSAVEQPAPPFEEAIAGLRKLREDGRHPEAEGKRLLALVQASLGPDSPQAIEISGLLVHILMEIGKKRVPEAVTFARRALESAERIYPPGDLRLCVPIEDLGQSLEYFGAFEKSKHLYERSLGIKKSALGPDDISVAITLGYLAGTHNQLGDQAGARLLYERALEIHEASGGPERPSLAGLLYSLANVCRHEGDLEAARRFAERSVRIMERTPLPEGGFLGVSLDALADVHRDLGNFEEAVAIHDRALRFWIDDIGQENINVAGALSSQALALSALGEHEAAIAKARRGLRIQSKLVDPDDRTLVMYFRFLSKVLFNAGQAAEAEPLMERALRLHRMAYGSSHLRQAQILDELSRIEYQLGKDEEALEHALQGEMIAREEFQDAALLLSERQAYLFESSRASSLRVVLSVLSRGRARITPEMRGRALDELVRSRALVLDELTSRHRDSMEQEGPEVAKLARDLQVAKAELASLVLRWPGASGDPVDEIADAAARKEQTERELAKRSLEHRRRLVRRDVGLASVQSALPPRSAVVSYVEYDRVSESTPGTTAAAAPAGGDPHYAALVLTTSSKAPSFFPLGSARGIDALASLWNEAVRQTPSGLEPTLGPSEERYRQAGEALRKRIWDPLAASLEGAAIVFVVPDGALHLVDFGTLPLLADRYLVEAGPLLHYLSAERDLVQNSRRQYEASGALILGGPDLDAAPPELRADSRLGGGPAAAHPADRPAAEGRFYRSAPPACQDFNTLRFESLPGAKAEVAEVKALLGTRAGIVELTGAEATEAAFKTIAPGRRLLHLATHGFFMQGRCESALSGARRRGASADWPSQSTHPVTGDNPLLLSGLALAGANRRGELRAADGEDGILTAEEVGTLDLSGVEWAVLSACETGVGKVLPGEGVLGLRRAFVVAGAGTLIMSLWRVEDEATRQWMARLYERRLAGRSTAEAVRDACVSTIEERRSRGRSTHPFFWGGFVAEGDWR